MKNLILVLVLIGLGGWYYYDNYGVDLPFLSEKTKKVDPRIDEIKLRGEKFFPTKLDDRERWIKVQISAMNALDKKIADLPDDVHSSLLKQATTQYPENYSSQLSFVKKQATAYQEIEKMLSESSFSGNEKKMLKSELVKTFGDNYSGQCDILTQALEVYGMVKSKSMQMPQKDFEKIASKVIHNLVRSPSECLLFFENQIRARHNFLTKQLPASYANLRAEIEKRIPDDFVAQLNELNIAIDNIVNVGIRNNLEDEKNLSKNAIEAFKKYIYLIDTSERTYNVSFATMQGKKVVLVPTQLLQSAKGIPTLNLGGGDTLLLDKLFLSQNSTFAIQVIEGDNRLEVVKFAPKDYALSKKSIDVEIVGSKVDGRKATISAKLEQGKYLRIEESEQGNVHSWFSSGCLIIEKETGVMLGYLEIAPNYDIKTYASYAEPTVEALLNKTIKVSDWVGLKDGHSLAKKNMLAKYDFRIVYLEDFKKFAKFDSAKYNKQKNMVGDICRVNMSALSFMLEGMYGADAEDDLLKNVTEKFDPIFVNGSRCTASVLRSNFFKYIQSVRSLLRSNADIARASIDEFYYDFTVPAKRQHELYKKLDAVIADTMAKSDIRNIIHEDILGAIKGDTYIPPQRKFDRPSSGVISGGLVIRNKGVKKDYNRQ